jgi:Cytochrome c554 and c-prime
VKSPFPIPPAIVFGLATLLFFFVLSTVVTRAQTPASSSISLPTELRVNSSGWWPTKGEAARNEYVGSEACVECHELKAEAQQQTAMFHAAARAAYSKSLGERDHLTAQIGPYSYQIETHGDKSVLIIKDSTSSLSAELLWAFGSAHMGQTFLYQQSGAFYESHLSFYASSQVLDTTPGQSSAIPQSLAVAAGRKMSSQETVHCFACHTTASVVRNQFDPAKAMPGVNCEACHGPGAKHVAAANAKTEKRGSGLIFNPAILGRVDSVDFCGACHRTWQDAVSANLSSAGTLNVRFAPYRLENSQCWAEGDARIACIGCHDPHKPLVHDLASYDQTCLQCHVSSASNKRSSARPGAACPVAAKNCVSCHMPKVSPPSLHSTFTDHWIRIAKTNSSYPE